MQTALATTSLASGVMFTLYTYVVPLLNRITRASGTFITVGLAVSAVGFTIGGRIDAHAADRDPERNLSLVMLLLAAVLVVFPFLAHTEACARHRPAMGVLAPSP